MHIWHWESEGILDKAWLSIFLSIHSCVTGWVQVLLDYSNRLNWIWLVYTFWISALRLIKLSCMVHYCDVWWVSGIDHTCHTVDNRYSVFFSQLFKVCCHMRIATYFCVNCYVDFFCNPWSEPMVTHWFVFNDVFTWELTDTIQDECLKAQGLVISIYKNERVITNSYISFWKYHMQ